MNLEDLINKASNGRARLITASTREELINKVEEALSEGCPCGQEHDPAPAFHPGHRLSTAEFDADQAYGHALRHTAMSSLALEHEDGGRTAELHQRTASLWLDVAQVIERRGSGKEQGTERPENVAPVLSEDRSEPEPDPVS